MKTDKIKTVKILPLIAALVILLGGCSTDFGRAFPFLTKQSLFKIEGDISPNAITSDALFVENELYILQCEESESDGNTEYFIYKINAKNARVTEKKQLDGCPVAFPSGLDTDGDGNIILFGYEGDSDKKVCVAYSSDTLELNGKKRTYSPSEPEIEREENDFGLFFYEGGSCATYEIFDLPVNKLTVFSFRDSPDTAFFAYSMNFAVFSDYGRLVIGKKDSNYGNESDSETVAVYDFENSVLVNKLEREKSEGDTSKFISMMSLNDRYAFLVEETPGEDKFSADLFIWQYRKGAVNEPFEAEEKTIDILNTESAEICKKIKKDYGINVQINSKEFDFYEKGEEYYISPDASVFDAHITLLRLKEFLDLLPKGFVKEIYTDLDFCSYDGFDIFIGGQIEGTSSAYTMTFLENMTIVFGAQATDMRTVAHEFMHAMDVRIEDSLTDISLYEIWSEKNDGFEYTGYSSDNSYYEDEEYDSYFVSAYSTATDGEDRAEIFSYLFTDSFSDTLPPEWYKDNAPLKAKTDLLIRLIRDSFESLENVKTAQWEKTVASESRK